MTITYYPINLDINDGMGWDGIRLSWLYPLEVNYLINVVDASMT